MTCKVRTRWLADPALGRGDPSLVEHREHCADCARAFAKLEVARRTIATAPCEVDDRQVARVWRATEDARRPAQWNGVWLPVAAAALAAMFVSGSPLDGGPDASTSPRFWSQTRRSARASGGYGERSAHGANTRRRIDTTIALGYRAVGRLRILLNGTDLEALPGTVLRLVESSDVELTAFIESGEFARWWARREVTPVVRTAALDVRAFAGAARGRGSRRRHAVTVEAGRVALNARG